MKHGLLLSGVAAVVLLANGAHAQAPMQITPPAARTAASVPSKPAKKPVLAKPAVAKPAVAKPALKKSIEPKAAKSVPSPTPPMPSAFAPEQIPAAPFAAPGDAKARKHPRLAINEAGEVLMVWTEGTSFQKGGSLAWQLYDSNRNPIAAKPGQAPGLPVWSLPAAFATREGDFVILY